MLHSIIIDRVGNTNVFNLINDNSINNPLVSGTQSLQSVIDQDLIDEYLDELGRIANISRSLSTLPRENEENQAIVFQHLNLGNKLREIGHAFYRQFIPEPLQTYLDSSTQSHLFFHLAPALSSIPLELLHDGSQFLWEKFFLGKSVKGLHRTSTDITPEENLNILIIADPTEDLEWARQEGESLFEFLTIQFADKKVNIELLGGRNVTKLNLLNTLLNKDIVHYAGHLHYTDNPEENGWLLYGNKVIHAREIQKSGAEPSLIFSNSCVSGRNANPSLSDDSDWYSKFAGSFLRSGVTNYIGTNWEMPDTRPTIEFTRKFYETILQGETLGEALQKCRQYARDNFTLNDLTWASYMLMGNPERMIYRPLSRIPDLNDNILDYNKVISTYPQPVAEGIKRFVELNDAPSDNRPHREIVQALLGTYASAMFLITALLLANYDLLDLPREMQFEYPDIEKCLESSFKVLNSLKAIKARPLLPNLLEVMYIHRDNLNKLAAWYRRFNEDEINNEELESYEITIQYILESFLIDLDFIKNYGFYFILEAGHRQLSLQGTAEHHRVKDIILPTQVNIETHEELLHKTENMVGHFVFYNPIKKQFLDLKPYITINIDAGSEKALYQLDFVSQKKSLQKTS